MLDSAAASQARVAVDAMTGGTTLFGSRWVPRFLDTDPPVAAVGWMEHEASDAGLEVGVNRKLQRWLRPTTKQLRNHRRL